MIMAHEQNKDGGDTQTAVELPALSKKQIQAVLAKAEVVKNAAGSGDIQKIKTAFSEFDQALKSVDMKLLTGHVHMLWMEYHMRLSNDAIEGMKAETLRDAGKATKSLAENISSMAVKFGLVHKHITTEVSRISDTFRKQLAKVFEGYFAMQQALSNDNVKLAAESAKHALDTLKAVDMKLLSGSDHDKWMKFSAELESVLSNVGENKDIKLIREDFHLLSQQLAQVAEHFGSTGQSPFYLLHCPMAFNNTGANWLQDNEQTRNPYFGQKMPQCGGVKEIIDVKEIWEKMDK